MTGDPSIVVVADAAAVAQAAATRFTTAVAAAIAARGRAHVALTGGSTAPPLYECLADPDRSAGLDWSRIELWWGDDRFVPLDHPASNAGVAIDLLTDRLRLPVATFHPWPVTAAIGRGEGPDAAATAYADEVAGMVPLDRRGDPVFDLLLLGVGPDGHVLSCFPGSPGLAADAPLALGIPAPTHLEPHLPRVTFRARVIGAARAVLVLTPGGGKAAILARILEGPADPTALPAQAARLATATWLLDRPAAADLGG